VHCRRILRLFDEMKRISNMDKVTLNIANALTQTSTKTNADKNKEEEARKLKKVCQDFESIFTYNLLKNMRNTILKSSDSNLLSGKDTYNMIMDQKVAEEISKKGNGLGLQKVVFDQLNKNYVKEVTKKNIK
jgi:peptidoglycan hydrolase FlgJ